MQASPGTTQLFCKRLRRIANVWWSPLIYRLAPETHFPGSLEDNYTALRWIYHNADELGVDRKRIAYRWRKRWRWAFRATRDCGAATAEKFPSSFSF